MVSRFFSDLLMNEYCERSNSSPRVSSSARSILSLKMMRPTVVSVCVPSAHYGRYCATSCSCTRPCSYASSASWAERNTWTFGSCVAGSMACSSGSSGP